MGVGGFGLEGKFCSWRRNRRPGFGAEGGMQACPISLFLLHLWGAFKLAENTSQSRLVT